MDDAPRLARVRWYQGQILLPGHLRALEDSLLCELRHRLALELGPPPRCGVLRVALDQAELARGALRLVALSAVLPSGELVQVGGNLLPGQPAPLMLAPFKQSYLTIFLNVAPPPPREATLARGRDCSADAVERALRPATLSAQRPEPGAEALAILRLRRSGKDPGRWEIDPGFIPSLLRVEPAPFLGWLQDELRVIAAEQRAGADLALLDPALGDARRAALRRFTAAATLLLAQLDDLRVCAPHPYALITQLRAFCVELHCLQELPVPDLPAYDPGDLGPSFAALRELIAEAAQRRPPRMCQRAFRPGDPDLEIAPLPPGLAVAPEVYLMLQWPAVAQMRDLAQLLPHVKLASKSRIDAVCRGALRGVRLVESQDYALLRTLPRDVQVLRVDTTCADWGQALRESALALRAPLDELAAVSFSLQWREP